MINWRELIPFRGRTPPETWSLAQPRPWPSDHYNEVLPNQQAIDESVSRLAWRHPTTSKTWDLLKALCYLAQYHPDHSTRVLDMGCVGSPVLEVLYGWGYRTLAGVDFGSKDLPRVPNLDYARGSLTATKWPGGSFDVITCMSVLEHGVPLEEFVAEADRLLSPSGSLLLSVDYHHETMDTTTVPPEVTFGLPWTVFDRGRAEELIDQLRSVGLIPVDQVRWEQQEAPVSWNGMDYTFLFLAFARDRDAA